jgi:small subunit ribosomal protein S6
MREYELTVVYDLAVAEAGGQEAGPQRLTSFIEGRGGQVIKIDHWGRRRMAYPIGRAIDGDYVVSRINFEPANVAAMEAALKIDERVYRHLVVRADELPPPPPPREPREPRPAPAAEATEAPATAPVAEAPASVEEAGAAAEAEAPAAAPAEPAAEPTAAVAEEPAAAVEPAASEEPVAEAEPAAEEPAEE